MSDYTTRLVATDDASLARYHRLFESTLGTIPVDYLRWLYARCPHGPAVGFDAFAGGDYAAHYATVPVLGRLDGRETKGLLSLNTATHPNHQGKGLFTRLAEQTYAHAASHGYEFVVGVANANSTPGFIKKLGFQLVSPLDVVVGLGRLEPSRDDAKLAFTLSWSAEALRWRLARPDARYFASRTSDSALVYTQAHKLGVVAVMASTPLEPASALPPPRRTHAVRMWIGLDPNLRRRGAFAPLPDRLKPSPLNLIFRDLSGSRRQLPRDATRFTLLDFDAY
jgi:GNAT superfamily N-acetyltransferase